MPDPTCHNPSLTRWRLWLDELGNGILVFKHSTCKQTRKLSKSASAPQAIPCCVTTCTAGKHLATHSPFDQVKARRSLDHSANLAGLQRKCRVLEFALHVTLLKEAPVHSSQRNCKFPANVSTHKSPPLRALLQSDSVAASSAKEVSPAFILRSCSWIISMASSLVRVILASRQLEGRRLPSCLTSR